MGQGGDIGTLTHTVKALEPLGIMPEQVHLVMGDTKICPDTGIAAASRSHVMAGQATLDAAKKLMDAMRKPDGSYRSYNEMVAENIPTKYVGRYDLLHENLEEPDPNTGVGDRAPQYMYCLNIGQAYGGISHSIGFALSENYYDVMKDKNIEVCGIPHISHIPDDIRVIYIENPRLNGPHGSKGCSEDFQASGHMAVINAIDDAAGVRIYELPATPAKVKGDFFESKTVSRFCGSLLSWRICFMFFCLSF